MTTNCSDGHPVAHICMLTLNTQYYLFSFAPGLSQDFQVASQMTGIIQSLLAPSSDQYELASIVSLKVEQLARQVSALNGQLMDNIVRTKAEMGALEALSFPRLPGPLTPPFPTVTITSIMISLALLYCYRSARVFSTKSSAPSLQPESSERRSGRKTLSRVKRRHRST